MKSYGRALAAFMGGWFVFSAGAADLARSPLAWIRFDDSRQVYEGKGYRFLGDGDIHLQIDCKPDGSQWLEFLWGAKNDTRDAVVVLNGRSVVVRKGGYKGFEWVKVPVPGDLGGDKLEVVMKGGPERPGFVAEVRLTSSAGGTMADVTARSRRVTVVAAAENAGAFAEMRGMWDRQPAAAEKGSAEEAGYVQAERNARLAAEGLFRCHKYVEGWLAHADGKSGLIPRNLTRDVDLWNGRDSAADNYPFMVLTCALTDRPLFEGRMRDILRTEVRVTSRLDRLGDHYSFSKQGFMHEGADLERMVFDNAEYAKDGLVPITEWLGASAWSERMTGILEDIWKHAPISTPFGKIPTYNFEVNGDLLQACSRAFWFTGERKYLEWGMRLADFYLLGTNHPTRDLAELRLIDHGCEVVNGLSEVYFAAKRAAPEKAEVYRGPLHAVFDRILEAGRNEDGLLYVSFKRDGTHSAGLCDTWGYVYDGFYTMALADGTEGYREAARKALGNLKGKYVGACWADRSADGFADSIEGAINLLNREPVGSAADWVDSQTRLMWRIQKGDGIIEGWHGDGNFARTTLMYALWKTQGTHVEPWRKDVRVGAVRKGEKLLLSVTADEGWSGKLMFDKARHRVNLHMPVDYPRINQFPEWYVVDAGKGYNLRGVSGGSPAPLGGGRFIEGLPVTLTPGKELRLEITEAKGQ